MESQKKEEIPCIFYLYIHQKIYEWAGGKDKRIREVMSFLSEWKIPKEMKYLILKELEMLKLVKLNGTKRLRLKEPQFKDPKEYYQRLKIY